MRVAFLSDWWLPTTGGTERYMIDLGTHLQAEGHEVVVLHAVAPGSGLPQRETLEGLCTIRMPVSLSRDVAERCGLLTAQAHAVASLLESIWPGGPDILHSHSNWMGLRTLLAAQLLGRPAVVGLHVNWPLTPTVPCLRTCVGYEEAVCARCPYPHITDAAAVVREARWKGRLLADAAAVLAPSLPERERILSAFPVDPARAHVAPGWIDVDRFAARRAADPAARRALGLSLDEPVVLYVGRIFWMKGLRYLAEAIPQILAAHPSARFVFAGRLHEPEERQRVEDIVAASGAEPSRLVWTGDIPFADVPAIYRAADIFVLPSLVETQGLVLLEAMASGLPVVATDLPAIGALITPEETGLLVAPRGPAAIAAALGRLLDDPALRARLGEAGRSHVRSRYTREILARRVTDLYSGVARGAGN